ncbi:MAG: pyruvate kinase [Candidatus Gastranaerophilales bacterium]|nr:pyruvate kinase [Candidatus Gastranaerophilales bacterium]
MQETPKNKKIKTKIIATLGPASSDYNTIKKLAEAGVCVFRINTSHGEKKEHAEKIKIIRNIEEELNINIPVIIDLQGPKIRVGQIQNPVEITKGQEIILENTDVIKQGIIPVDYEGIANDVSEGEYILLDDGHVKLKVTKIVGSKVYTVVESGNIIKPRKGINLPGIQASLEAVTQRDKEYIKFAIEQNADYLALSFVRKAEDIKCAKYYTKAFGGKEIPVIAKIEKPQAVENLEEIVIEADALMAARGDLGIEMSPQDVPIAQKRIIQLANEYKKPCIVATQMLESMIEESMPTRAEAGDVANAIFDGADAIMLSGESAVGKYPVEAVKMMAAISKTVETSSFLKTDFELELISEFDPVAQAIANSAVSLSKKLKAEAILIFSEYGYTPPIISKLKPTVPVIVITKSRSIARRLSLFWDIFAYVEEECNIILDETAFKKIDNILIKKTILEKGDNIIIVNSAPELMNGKINTIRIHTIGSER